MASASKGQTVISFPEPVSFIIDLTIPKFSSLKAEATTIVSSEVMACQSAWTLGVCSLEKTVEKGTEVDCVGAFVHRKCLEKEQSEISVDFKISILRNGSPSTTSPKLNQRHLRPFIAKPGKTISGCNVVPFILHSDIWGDNATLQLDEDTLKMRLVAKCNVLKEHRKSRTPLGDVLRKRTIEMYSLEIGRDFVLVSSQGTEHKVHKNILCAASPVFRGMLESDMKEDQTGRCEIEDVKKATLVGLIRFMYFGCVEGVKDNAKNLLEAADKYQVLDLKDRCEDVLIDSLNMDNVVDLLLFADKMSAPELKQAAMRYMAQDPEKTMASEGMKDLIGSGNTELTTEVFTAMLKLPAK